MELLHVFLPHRIPKISPDEEFQSSAKLLELVCDSTKFIAASIPEIKSVCRIFETWKRVQISLAMGVDTPITEIKELRKSDFLPIYLRAQNALLLLHVPSDGSETEDTVGDRIGEECPGGLELLQDGNVVIAVFHPHLPAAQVTEAAGDLHVTYPFQSIVVKANTFLTSSEFGLVLRELSETEFPLAMARYTKAGQQHTNTRDVRVPTLVTEWLSAIVGGEAERFEWPETVVKKYRDVAMSDGFRRSAMWISIKAVLQLILVSKFGADRGKMMYKLSMLHSMVVMLSGFEEMDHGFVIEMMAKLSRRATKISNQIDSFQEYASIFSSLLVFLDRETFKKRHLMEEGWMDICRPIITPKSGKNIFIKHSELYTVHENLTDHVMTSRRKVPHEQLKLKTPRCPPRYRGDMLIDSHRLKQNGNSLDIIFLLDDTERSVKRWTFDREPNVESSSLLTLLEEYLDVAVPFYATDPVGKGRMTLTSLKIIQSLHQIAVAKYPQLQNHQHGMDLSIIEDLILPLSEDLELASRLEQYFNTTGTQPSLFGIGNVEKDSFAVSFAKGDSAMRELHHELMKEQQTGIDNVLKRVEEAKKEILLLVELAGQETHVHVKGRSCYSCRWLTQSRKVKVTPYEKILPERYDYQWAVVFELLMPPQLAALRDALYLFGERVTQTVEGKENLVGVWHETLELRYNYSGKQQHVILGSSLRRTKSGGGWSPTGRVAKEFVLNHGFNLRYANKNKLFIQPVDISSINRDLSFRVEPNSKYKNLQWTLEKTTHSQNKVLASQINCHANLTLPEYREFGSLRVGHRLQLRNIYRSLEENILSFNEESVVALICQALWQAGPPSEVESVARESHRDMEDPEFVSEMLSKLEQLVEEVADNWERYCGLLRIIVIALRIYSFVNDEAIGRRVLAVLDRSRAVAMRWCDKIEAQMQKSTEIHFRQLLVEAAICSALTFWCDDFHQDVLSVDAVFDWLKTISRINDNFQSIDSSQTFCNNWLRVVSRIGIKLESSLFRSLNSNHEGLLSFVDDYWRQASNNDLLGHRIHPKSTQFYVLDYQKSCGSKITVEIDIVRGVVLLNGSPITGLSNDIKQHEEFCRVFETDSFAVSLTSATIPCFETSKKYDGSLFSFQLRRNELTVIETVESKQQWELVPHKKFHGLIPPAFVSHYSHWLNRETHVIEFRPKRFADKEFHKSTKIYIDLTRQKLIKDQLELLDISSPPYIHIFPILRRLEYEAFIHIWFDSETGKTSIELYQMGLTFFVEEDGFFSKEYSGFKIAESQQFGAFIGLENGLLLEPICRGTLPLLLMPHGPLNFHEGLNWHHSVSIDTKNLRTPRFFVYEVDHRLKTLMAGRNVVPWLYQAYLFGATSSYLPNPFTNETGLETSIQLLQSPRCWSPAPFEKEAITILEAIATLSPDRKYVPTGFRFREDCSWPSKLSSFAAHDAYVLVVEWLLQQSHRIGFCFPHCATTTIHFDHVRLDLAKKHYAKWVTSYPEFAKLSENIALGRVTSKQASLFDGDLNSVNLTNARAVVEALDQNKLLSADKLKAGCLKAVLVTMENLIGVNGVGATLGSSLTEWLDIDFRTSWMTLYQFAKEVKGKKLWHQWRMILATLAFKGLEIEHLNALLIVSLFPKQFKDINVPVDEEFQQPKQHDYDGSQIEDLLDRQIQAVLARQPAAYSESGIMELSTNLEEEKTCLLGRVQDKWISDRGATPFKSKVWYMSVDVFINIDLLLTKWERNSRLFDFLSAVESTMMSCYSNSKNNKITCSRLDPILVQKPFEIVHPFEFTTLDDLIDERSSATEDAELKKIYETGQWEDTNDESSILDDESSIFDDACSILDDASSVVDDAFPLDLSDTSAIGHFIQRDLEISWTHKTTFSDSLCSKRQTMKSWNARQDSVKEQSERTWIHIQRKLSANSSLHKICHRAGVYPRCTPTALLRRLEMKNGSVMEAVGAVGVLWVLEQKLGRLINYSLEGKASEVALERELSEEAHGNWSPKKYPEWLLFELENKVAIREVQVEVAMKMLVPDDSSNAVMQLNMGEGKTTVILPIVAASLANGSNLCRVTVLTSLFHTNFQDLRHKLGGMLNRRVYDIPCKRGILIDAGRASAILKVFQECRDQKGVVLTLPESRLSFQLKGYEAAQKQRSEASRMLLHVQNWLNSNARDILDESDEILRPKYQLVYTMGEQLLVDGGTIRWQLFQELLQLVPNIFRQLTQEPDFSDCIEIEPSNERQRFPRCRVLNIEKCRSVLSGRLVDAVLSGKLGSAGLVNISSQMKQEARNFLLTRTIIDPESHCKVIEMFRNFQGNALTVLLILKGLIAEGTLIYVLSKRWRVNYGVNLKGPRLMAIPFKAKDIAIENTEFGHADVAIGFTLMSYYFSGLSDQQLLECFNRLDRIQDADDEYNSWTELCENVHPSIAKLSGVNLNDYNQRIDILFKALRFNIRTIHFWLGTVVFPKESKQFPYKLVATPWDLTSNRVTTGFSGTNDRKLLLPLSYTQKDLPRLLGTNANVLRNVLREENSRSEFLPPLCESRAIIQKLVEYDSPLLLDVGGLVLMSNEDVAAEWLKIAPNRIEAAVYLDRKDRLVVKERRRAAPMLLESSPYRQRLDLCVVYLDQYHCRGTDLKIPTGTVGVLTLGEGITKDQLLQGAMRMRLLGRGHSIRFLISHELKAVMPGSPESKDIIKWAIKNTIGEIDDGFIHWSVAGCNYLRKHTSKVVFESSSGSDIQLERFGNDCTEIETIDLEKLYGVFKELVPYSDLIGSQLVNLKNYFLENLQQLNVSLGKADQEFNTIQTSIFWACRKYIPTVTRCQSRMNEEQQRELEQELQEERQVSRPPSATPHKAEFDERILDFVINGRPPSPLWSKRLPEGLRCTKLWGEVQPDCWGEDIYITTDFMNVVKRDSQRDGVDEFLRPVNWMAVLYRRDQKPVVLVLSPNEANEVMPLFRIKYTLTQLHIFSPVRRLNQDSLVSRLVLAPSNINSPSSVRDLPLSTIANLSLFAGGMYFRNIDEQEAFCSLLGIIPQPRTEEEHEIINRSGSLDGFIQKIHRPSNWPCRFTRSAGGLVKGIIARRWESFSRNSHVSRLLNESMRAFIQEVS